VSWNGKTIAAMATAIALVALVVGATRVAGGRRNSSPPAIANLAAFTWLKPQVAPAGWSTWRLPGSPAQLSAAPGWRREQGDAGTRTAVLRTRSGEIAGYLNATPGEGAESTRNWTKFRVAHNKDEGEREVRLLAAATHLRFRSGLGSCVLDSYRTQSGNRYREVACIVSGPSATTVIVGAAPPPRWEAEAPTIEQAFNSFTT
jgi:hypothetical protein